MTTTDPLAAVRAARAAQLAADAAVRDAVIAAHRSRAASVAAIAEAAGLKTRQTVYTWAKEDAMSKLATLVADCSAGRLRDICAQVWPGRDVRVTDGRMAEVTLPEEDADTLARELDARKVEWGWQ